MSDSAAPSRPLSFSLSPLWTWWTGELLGLVPHKIKSWYRSSINTVAMRHGGSEVSVLRIQGEALEEIGRVDMNAGTLAEQKHAIRVILAKTGRSPQVFLCLPEGQILKRQLQLPLALEENLRQSMEFELDRYTPFKPHQVYHDVRITGRDANRRLLSVELTVAPKSALDTALRAAAELGLVVHKAVIAEDLLRNGGYSANLLPLALRPKPGRRRLQWHVAAFFLAMLLLATALAIPIWQKREVAILMNDQMLNAKAAARITSNLREQLDKLVFERNFLHDKKATVPSPLLVLEDLSRLLPDDTYLQQLDINGKDLQIQGETASASRIIEVMEQSPFFKNESFKSPLTKIPGTSSERFHIAADIKLPVPAKTTKIDTGKTSAASVAPAINAATATTSTPVGNSSAPTAQPQDRRPR